MIKRLILAIALLLAGVAFWRKLHIVVFVRATLPQLLLFYLILGVGIYLLLDSVIDRLTGR
jgi:hypothetical protein